MGVGKSEHEVVSSIRTNPIGPDESRVVLNGDASALISRPNFGSHWRKKISVHVSMSREENDMKII